MTPLTVSFGCDDAVCAVGNVGTDGVGKSLLSNLILLFGSEESVGTKDCCCTTVVFFFLLIKSFAV